MSSDTRNHGERSWLLILGPGGSPNGFDGSLGVGWRHISAFPGGHTFSRAGYRQETIDWGFLSFISLKVAPLIDFLPRLFKYMLYLPPSIYLCSGKQWTFLQVSSCMLCLHLHRYVHWHKYKHTHTHTHTTEWNCNSASCTFHIHRYIRRTIVDI